MMYLYFLLGIFLGTNAGIIIFSLVIKNKITCLEDKLAASRKRIERQTSIIFTMRKELVEAKGAAASEETCADLLMRMKDDLQKDYDQLLAEHKELMTEYKIIYVELDKYKASEVRKFRDPEEIKSVVDEMIDGSAIKILAG